MKTAPRPSTHSWSLLFLLAVMTAGLFPLSAQANLVLETRLESGSDWLTAGFLFLKVEGSQVHFDLWTQYGYDSPATFRIDSTDNYLTVQLNEGRTIRFDYDRFGFDPVLSNPFLEQPILDDEPEWLPIDRDGFQFDRDRLTHPALTLWVEQRGMINDPALAELLRNGDGLAASVDLLQRKEIDGEMFVIRRLQGEGALTEGQFAAIPEPATVGVFAGAAVLLVVIGSRRFGGKRAAKTIA